MGALAFGQHPIWETPPNPSPFGLPVSSFSRSPRLDALSVRSMAACIETQISPLQILIGQDADGLKTYTLED